MRADIRIAVMMLVALLGAGCSAYFTPYVDLVVRVTNPRDESALRDVLARYAERRQWRAYPAANDSPVPESVRRLNARTTNYLSGTSEGSGRSLTLFDATADCKVIRLVERSRQWNDDSEQDLRELQGAVRGIAGSSVETGVRYSGSGAGRAISDYCPGWEHN